MFSYAYIETSLILMAVYVVLCPHRDTTNVYVHINQDFFELPEELAKKHFSSVLKNKPKVLI